MEEKITYAYTHNGTGSFSDGPTPDLDELLNRWVPGSPGAQIYKLLPDGNKIVSHEWTGTEWVELTPADDPPPWDDPFMPGPGKLLVMGELGITGGGNEMLMVSGKVLQINVESKAKAGEYQNDTRAYVPIAPDNLHVHILVQDPAQYVDESGDLGLLAHVLGRIARTVDMEVVSVASMRLDRAIAEQDLKAATKPRRADVKPRKEVPAQTEVL